MKRVEPILMIEHHDMLALDQLKRNLIGAGFELQFRCLLSIGGENHRYIYEVKKQPEKRDLLISDQN
ncbi:hypothetical protein SAMN05444392_11172 [Seinonella peptonophila]|uniref:Uncharacterized protein n=1 Tax=Seinonella peptonophila TaxID=112248 RepID=A0A1M5A0Y2_9BACL|nr:hypothetical protein [Seinonella peptonophila]SHF23546.1 hypothetical protein SAMN05444392_11172 [Seinonella peptonophila]